MKKMKKGTLLDRAHHVMRHVPWARLRRDADDNVIGFLPQAFELREAEQALSVNWVEYHDGGSGDAKAACVKTFREMLDIKKKSAFGVGNVGKIGAIRGSTGKSIRTIYSPTNGNKSHSLMQGKPIEELAVQEMLATEIFTQLIKNSDI